MKLLLIQPPDDLNDPFKGQLEARDDVCFAPDWDLRCLRAHVLAHSRYLADYVDARLFRDMEKDLVAAVEKSTVPVTAALLKISSANLGPATAVLDLLKVRFPHIRTLICGPFPSHYPSAAAALPRVDFAIAGDAEPVLTGWLNYRHAPKLLNQVPGLLVRESEAGEAPVWTADLQKLTLPEPNDVFWPAYRTRYPDRECRCRMRVSRGQTEAPADMPFPARAEPLRYWPLRKTANLLQKTAAYGINRVYLADPPGIWTDRFLKEWTQALAAVRNSQSWSFQMCPRPLEEDCVYTLAETGCSEVEWIFPSCRGEILESYGATGSHKALTRLYRLFESAGIDVRLKCWLGGPGEPRKEAGRIIHIVGMLKYPDYSLHVFPMHLESRLFEERKTNLPCAPLDEWIAWSRNPWLSAQPLHLWAGNDNAPRLRREAARIHRTIARSPSRIMRLSVNHLRSRNWIRYIEDRMVTLAGRELAPQED